MLAFFFLHAVAVCVQRWFSAHSPLRLPPLLSRLLTLAFIVASSPLFFSGFGVTAVEAAQLYLTSAPAVLVLQLLMMAVDAVELLSGVAGLLGRAVVRVSGSLKAEL